jgi:hypothetical protein
MYLAARIVALSALDDTSVCKENAAVIIAVKIPRVLVKILLTAEEIDEIICPPKGESRADANPNAQTEENTPPPSRDRSDSEIYIPDP